jgi:hypothetical protein
MAKRKRPVGETIGGILVGFDQQVFRTTPPAQELVRKGQPVRGLSGEDGGTLDVIFPDDTGAADADGVAPTTDPREPRKDGPSGP